MPSRKGQKNVAAKFDSNFRFLLDLDPALKGWRAWATEYWAGLPKTNRNIQASLSAFLVTYLHGQGLHTLPSEKFFARHGALPTPDAALGLVLISEQGALIKHDAVSDFLDWILRQKLSVPDADGHRVVPPHLANPFPRRSIKLHGKTADLSYAHVLRLDPKLEGWRSLAAEWLKDQKSNVATRRDAVDRFLIHYIHGQNLERNYGRFLLRETKKPDFAKVIVGAKREGTQTLRAGDVMRNNTVADFLDWVLAHTLGDPDTGEWDRSRFHNPVQRLTKVGLPTNNQSDKASLSIRYIHELRGMLAEGRNFRDWAWAQQAMEDGKHGGDWFIVAPQLLDPNDPDCVARQRAATWYEIENKGYPAEVWELWSPVRAMALYLKLELPLRTFQVRMLDSGEADTWRYVHAPGGGGFVLNHGPLASGSAKRPCQRGVFHRSANEEGAGFFINTNKTADSNKAENEKGYVIPWAIDEVLYWLEKLRNWQERYNAITMPTPWAELERKHFGATPPHPEVLAQRGSACFLFRDPTRGKGDKPLDSESLSRFWYKLLKKLEQRCADHEQMLDDGTPLRFVDPDSVTVTYFPLHALRVSLISYFILDLKLPIAVVSKMIAGHATIIMTLYYTKFGKAYMREVLREAEKHELEAEQANHRRFLQDATFEQVSQRFAYVSEDAVQAAIQNRSAAAFVFDDKGICPNGATLCDVGGERLLGRQSEQVYGPVPGFPQERNCTCCRFFLTGPAFLPGLIAHFNTVSEKTHRQSVRYSTLQDKLTDLEDLQRAAERENQPFLRVRELDQLNKYVEAEALTLNKYVNDLQATNHLIERSLQIAADRTTDGVKFVAKGSMADLKVGFIESQSVLHQLEVVCENAVIYPEIDAGFATIRRAQMLDAMLRYNGMDPVLMYLDQEAQLLVGNAVMQLIQARTGSIKGALPYAECRLKLKEIGLLKGPVLNEIAQVKAQVLLDHAKAKRALTPPQEDHDDAP
ncbi:gamma-mobile-trio integrase GmtZ [Vogesella indigofera]|uniref:gamma-mobile-trio integrase GmtZ n=1 Tax=Vogesella indigofera TaxID=45465 RepID=UPI00234FA862|nr:integrase family protein [Vogesella indigofera]MDC7708481.1 integrase family protein [Vogesella indigofera]